MSFFDNDNLPILAAFAIAAPELFAEEAVASDVAAEEAAKEAARQAAEEAARKAAEEAAKKAAEEAANQGIMQAGTMTPQQAAYMDASSASLNSGITPGTVPTPPPAPPSGGIPQGLQTNTGFGQTPVEPININPQTSGYGNVIDNGGMNAPQPSALESGWSKFSQFAETNPQTTAALGYTALSSMGALNPRQGNFNNQSYSGPLSKYRLSPNFQGRTANPKDYQYTPRQYAAGGILSAAGGGPVEQMSNANAIGASNGYPMAGINKATYATPYQTPMSQNVVQGTADVGVNPMTGEQNRFAAGGNVQLQGRVTIDDQGGGQGGQFGQGVNGYQAAGSGGQSGGQQSILGGGLDPRAIAANPQGFQRFMQGAQQQEMQRPGSTMFSQLGGAGMAPPSLAMAQGGIASYAKGGNLSSSLEYYTDMMDGGSQRHAPVEKFDPGIYRDTDPDTMYLDPLSAAQVRMAKVNKRANIQGMNMKRPTPMGQLNLRPPGSKAEAGGSSLDPENAAQGGIMQAHGHLGGYASGGQPRLLRGPGDGMSDNIPATIAGKQPARLADGEFVVPADVVSHLGNGSTEAGAKMLHKMMTDVRKARTGNPKQGKQINPSKFTPK